jgi:hypothetical protein
MLGAGNPCCPAHTIIQALNQFHTAGNDNGEIDAFKYY